MCWARWKALHRCLKKIEYYNEYFDDEVGVHASLVFHYTGIDITELDTEKAAKYIAMNRRAMLALKLMEEKVPDEVMSGRP